MVYEARFRYWTIEYVYARDASGQPLPDMTIRRGAYADKALAEMNARLNSALSATVREVWL